MTTRAKISAVRASGVRRLLTFFSQMRRLFEGGAYSSKYGILILQPNPLLWIDSYCEFLICSELTIFVNLRHCALDREYGKWKFFFWRGNLNVWARDSNLGFLSDLSIHLTTWPPHRCEIINFSVFFTRYCRKCRRLLNEQVPTSVTLSSAEGERTKAVPTDHKLWVQIQSNVTISFLPAVHVQGHSSLN